MTPIDPEMCLKTGRLLTEWFEYPEYTDTQLRQQAMDHFGIDEDPKGNIFTMPPEQADLMRKIQGFVGGKKRRRWSNTMSAQEVHHRMNEATKMINPDNFKFLSGDVRERTGLEINPLWMMECLVRSGVLNPKEQVAALKELAQYTHSKAPNIQFNTNTNMSPEDWLLELAKDEYKVIGTDIAMEQPMQRVERGMHKRFEKRLDRRMAETTALNNYAMEELASMESLVDAEWEDISEDDNSQ